MLRCSLKLTHDSTLALARGSQLLASIELEKVDNQTRWFSAQSLDFVEKILTDFGHSPEDVDRWLIDGWVADEPLRLTGSDGALLSLPVAPYRERGPSEDILAPTFGLGLRIWGAITAMPATVTSPLTLSEPGRRVRSRHRDERVMFSSGTAASIRACTYLTLISAELRILDRFSTCTDMHILSPQSISARSRPTGMPPAPRTRRPER
jgi:Carbamoyltransferase N-terminus